MNAGVARAVSEEAGIEVSVPDDPRMTGALGAAITAGSLNR